MTIKTTDLLTDTYRGTDSSRTGETTGHRGNLRTYRTGPDSWTTMDGLWTIRKDGTSPLPWTLYRHTGKDGGTMTPEGTFRTSEEGLLLTLRTLRKDDSLTLRMGKGRTGLTDHTRKGKERTGDR